MEKLIQLNVKTEFTFLESTIKIDDLVSFAQKNKLDTLAITDTNVMYGAMQFYLKCKKHNIKPLIGMELKKEDISFIVYAKNFNGYKNLCKLTTLINQKNFDKKKINLLLHDVVVIDASYSKDRHNLLKEDYYINSAKSSDDGEINKVKKLYVDTTRYLLESDYKLFHIITMIKEQKKIKDSNYQDFKKHFKFNSFDKKNIIEIIDKCNVEIPKRKINLKFLINENSSLYLKNLCVKALKEKKITSDEYIKRLMHELKLIDKMNFSDYFLVVWDYVKFAREKKILMSPGRGSVGGSLVAYLLNITTIDPIENNLLFERFLNSERISMPDIDIDFEDEKRDLVISYVRNKYGFKNVAQIVTFSTLKGKSSLRDIGRVLNIENDLINKMTKLVPIDTPLAKAYKESLKLQEYVNKTNKTKELYEIAIKVEGLHRQSGVHAAGVVISNDEISNICPLIEIESNSFVTQYSMEYLEELGLIKMDFLGLRNLSIISNVLNLTRKHYEKEIDLISIPLDDEKVFKLLANGDTLGIFQLESQGMKKTLMKIKPNSLEDIIATSSLFRPGPMANIPIYIKRKHDKEEIEYLHNDLKPILKSTYGIIIYQEQIMQIVQKIASFSLSKADILRRAISKKNLNLLSTLKKEFLKNGEKNGYEIEMVNKIYLLIEKFAEYGFNRSHAYGYSILGYQMAYLKVYFPLAFMSSLLSSVIGSHEKINSYISECKKNKLMILKPSINKSYKVFTIESNAIRFALQAIQGIGIIAINEILNERKKGKFNDIYETYVRLNISKTVFESLIYAGALDEFGFNRTTIFKNISKLENYKKVITIKKENKVIYDYNLVSKPKLDIFEKSFDEQEKEFALLGLYLSSHPLTKIKTKLNFEIINIKDASNYINKEIIVVGQLNATKFLKTKYGHAMAFGSIEDETGRLDVALFPGKYEKHLEEFKRGNILVIKGKVAQRQNLSLSISDIKIIKGGK